MLPMAVNLPDGLADPLNGFFLDMRKQGQAQAVVGNLSGVFQIPAVNGKLPGKNLLLVHRRVEILFDDDIFGQKAFTQRVAAQAKLLFIDKNRKILKAAAVALFDLLKI